MKTVKQKYTKAETVRGYLFALPWLIGFFVLTVFPMIYSLGISFTNYKGSAAYDIVWFTQYARLFTTDPEFIKALVDTFLFVLMSVPVNLFGALMIAVLLNRKTPGIKLYRALFYLPNLVTIVAVSLLWKWIFNPEFGLLNQGLKLFNIAGPDWLKHDFWAKPSLVMMGLWNVGGTVVIFLASLVDVPSSLYEAATIDGAGIFTKFFKITLPMISPIIYFNLIMALISGFQAFVPSFLMTAGAYRTNFIGLLIYNSAFGSTSTLYGKASAIAWVLLVVIVVITRTVMKFTNKVVFYGE